jgi:pimeloyl-ACP methyl ester carboxylesterase
MLEPHLFTREGRTLFGLHFRAQGTPRDFAVVLCNAFGKEYEISRTQVSRFGAELAAKGVGAYRFDYLGYGDSEGAFEEATFSSMCADLDAAIGEARRRCGVQRIVLGGLRLGAMVAEAVASRRSDVEGLVMWAPTVRPWDHLYETLRQNVSMQGSLFGKVALTRDQIVENVLAGRASRFEGYDLAFADEGVRLAAPLVRELQALAPETLGRGLSARTLLVHVSKGPEAVPRPLAEHAERLAACGVACELERALEPTLPWVHERIFAARSPDLFDKTFRWLGL